MHSHECMQNRDLSRILKSILEHNDGTHAFSLDGYIFQDAVMEKDHKSISLTTSRKKIDVNDPAQKDLFFTGEAPTHLLRHPMPKCHKPRWICRQPLQHAAANTVTWLFIYSTFGLKDRQHLCI